MTQSFVDMILVALVGKVATFQTVVMMAMKNKIDLATGIAVGSSLQIVLLVAMISVFSRYLFGAPRISFSPRSKWGRSRYLCWLSVLSQWMASRTGGKA